MTLEELRAKAVESLHPTEDQITSKVREELSAEEADITATRQSIVDRRANLDSEEAALATRQDEYTALLQSLEEPVQG